MELHDEIAKVAQEFYEKSGRIEGRDLDNWLEAEKIVMARQRGQQKKKKETATPEKKVLSTTSKRPKAKK